MPKSDDLQETLSKAQLIFDEPIIFEGYLQKLHDTLMSLLDTSEEEAEQYQDIEQANSQNIELANDYFIKAKYLLTLVEKQKKPFQNTSSTHEAYVNSPSAHSENDLPILPNEMVSHIFSFLSLKERLAIRVVCKQWNKVIQNSFPNEDYIVLPKPILGYILLNMKPAGKQLSLGKLFRQLSAILNESPQQIDFSTYDQLNRQLEQQLPQHRKYILTAYYWLLIIPPLLGLIFSGILILTGAKYPLAVFIPMAIGFAGVFVGYRCVIAKRKVFDLPITDEELSRQRFFSSDAHTTYRFFKTVKSTKEVSDYLKRVANTFSEKSLILSPPIDTAHRQDDKSLPLLANPSTNSRNYGLIS